MTTAADRLSGVHHVSALTANTARNLHFYRLVLGLRLVKRTVNQDDPSMYHLFYADQIGSAGTDMTFFDFPRAAPWRPGVNAIDLTTFRVTGAGALHYWVERLVAEGVSDARINLRDGRGVVDFSDPDGTLLSIVDDGGQSPVGAVRPESDVPPEFQISGLGYVHVSVADLGATDEFLTTGLGLYRARDYRVGDRLTQVYAMGPGSAAETAAHSELHATEMATGPVARHGSGGVHHVALRVSDEAALRRWLARVDSLGYANSGLIDRYYFTSVYLTDPNGLIIELATDGPGFTTDESLSELGRGLALPPFLEPRRTAIEASLRPLDLGPRDDRDNARVQVQGEAI